MTKAPSKIIAWADHNGPNYITRFDCQGEPEFERAEYTLKDPEAMREAGYVPVEVLGVNADLVNEVGRLREQLKQQLARYNTLKDNASDNFNAYLETIEVVTELRAQLATARNDALEEAAIAGSVTCYETRHVTLGDKVSDTIRAMKEMK